MVRTTPRDRRKPSVASAVDGARRGEAWALDALYAQFYGEVYHAVRAIVYDVDEAQDVTHNVFLKVIAAIGRYRVTDVPFAAWIRRVARNAALDAARAKTPLPSEGLDQGESASTEDVVELMDSLKTALSGLPLDQRRVLLMRHVGGYSPGEIADRLDKTESAVHALHHRARRTVNCALRTPAGSMPSPMPV